jgi:hypothetical protein
MAIVQRWQLAQTAPDNHLARFSHLPRPVAQVLFNRGLGDPEKAEQFLNGRYEAGNPFKMKGMNEAVWRL